MRETCPHCHAVAVIRTSEDLSPTMRGLYCRCTNPACGHGFVSYAEVICTLSPAAKPNLSVLLPVSATVQREALIRSLRRAPYPHGETLGKKTAANSMPKLPDETPAGAGVSRFIRTKHPAPDLFRAVSAAAREQKNPWHPAPGFRLPAGIGCHLPAQHLHLI